MRLARRLLMPLSRIGRPSRGSGVLRDESAHFTGCCPIREHTADGFYVGRCDFATYGGVCPRHGLVCDYTTRDDREVPRSQRRWS